MNSPPAPISLFGLNVHFKYSEGSKCGTERSHVIKSSVTRPRNKTMLNKVNIMIMEISMSLPLMGHNFVNRTKFGLPKGDLNVPIDAP